MRNPTPFERYWAAVLDNPRGPKEGAMTYIARIAELAAGLEAGAAPVKDFPETPEARLPYRDSA